MLIQNNRKGFTLIEVIVVAAIIAILAGILVPMIFSQIDESKIARAQGDVKAVQTAIMTFRKDTGQWPNLQTGAVPCAAAITLLTGLGNPPGGLAGMGFDNAVPLSLDDPLALNQQAGCYPSWKGAYMTTVPADPWGNSYFINSKDFGTGAPVWIMSAGPNQTVDTAVNATATAADDIGIRIQ